MTQGTSKKIAEMDYDEVVAEIPSHPTIEAAIRVVAARKGKAWRSVMTNYYRQHRAQQPQGQGRRRPVRPNESLADHALREYHNMLIDYDELVGRMISLDDQMRERRELLDKMGITIPEEQESEAA